MPLRLYREKRDFLEQTFRNISSSMWWFKSKSFILKIEHIYMIRIYTLSLASVSISYPPTHIISKNISFPSSLNSPNNFMNYVTILYYQEWIFQLSWQNILHLILAAVILLCSLYKNRRNPTHYESVLLLPQSDNRPAKRFHSLCK